ncbi:MAG: hypothetical protein ACOX52_04370 [Verrucomicrobiota bacterium]
MSARTWCGPMRLLIRVPIALKDNPLLQDRQPLLPKTVSSAETGSIILLAPRLFWWQIWLYRGEESVYDPEKMDVKLRRRKVLEFEDGLPEYR